MNFIKNALREFRHVVWPTREETKKYFGIVLAVLIAFGLYLFIVGNIFSEILFGLKNLVNPSSTNTADIQLPEGLEGLEGLNVETENESESTNSVDAGDQATSEESIQDAPEDQGEVSNEEVSAGQ